MGTSSSSFGPRSGVSFDPPWLKSVESEIGLPLEKISGKPLQSEKNHLQLEPTVHPVETAPPRRFCNARRNFSKYIKSGNQMHLKKALGSYSRIGMGGASRLASRMFVSTSTGAKLFNFLQGVRDKKDIKVREWVNQLTSKHLSAHDVENEIINQFVPSGGTLDEESCRDSMSKAFSNLLKRYPDVDLLNMNNNSIWNLIELFITSEVFNRINLDIGQLFESNKYTPQEAVSRMNDIQAYVKSEISVQIQKVRTNDDCTIEEINNLLQSAIKNTFTVFEEEI